MSFDLDSERNSIMKYTIQCTQKSVIFIDVLTIMIKVIVAGEYDVVVTFLVVSSVVSIMPKENGSDYSS